MKTKGREKRLAARMGDYVATLNGGKQQEAKVYQRASSGGYHRPGSKGRK